MADEPKRGVLIQLAVQGLVPVVGGCAGVLVGGEGGGMVGVAVGQAVDRAVRFFGGRIVERWAEWFAQQPPEVREQALLALAATPPEEVRAQVENLLLEKIPEASPEDRELALSYLTLLPGAVDRALTRMPDGGRTVPPTVSYELPQLLSLMPVHLPPYTIGQELRDTPYRLDALIGSGGFGAVYRASTRTLQHLPLAVKFCLDPTMAQTLHRERGMLERLMKAGGESWSPRVVRLYGYDLDHPTPYLVYEYVPGGDLVRYLNERRTALGRNLNAEEVLELVTQLAEALAFAHANGLVHRDLKPANVLVENGTLKLADFGLGGVAAQASLTSQANNAETMATLFRGAGTPLYMAPEQRRGQAPDPRHDLYSLGVLWYQLLVGDITRELHPGWARELAVQYQVPAPHRDLIERCVGWIEDRPADARELLPLLHALRVPVPEPASASSSSGDLRNDLLAAEIRQLYEAHAAAEHAQKGGGDPLAAGIGWAAAVGFIAYAFFRQPWPVISLYAIAAGLLGLSWTWFHAYHRRKTAQERLEKCLCHVESTFPEQVQSWGGPAILHNIDTMKLLNERLNPQPPHDH
jgi:serine/threonine protein kinase